ncbi:Type II CRISPR-associated endonuclease Cas1 [[Mycoplasma] cavipharyngis]|uniref:type II CRISPR-associated endonuclease Cas1 n=1 Tax=[Mycoplasma] cavipharyngis TaxID=92757 RepID=UPI003703A343
MGWKTIVISSNETLRLYLNNLEIENDSRRILIPMYDIDTIVIESYTAVYSNKLIETLMKHNINLILCDSKHMPFVQMIPIQGHHNSLKILEQQIKWDANYRNSLWKRIVSNKITNQKATLLKLNIVFNKDIFKYYIDNIQDLDILNSEGNAAKYYWKCLFGNKFIRDYSCQKFHQINSYLNYGYSILRGMVARSIIKKGLDPRISIFHRSFLNFFALASDLMEVFRPLVDYQVYQLLQTETKWNVIKEEIIKSLSNYKIKVNQKEFYLNNAIDIYIEKLQTGQNLEWVDLWD